MAEEAKPESAATKEEKKSAEPKKIEMTEAEFEEWQENARKEERDKLAKAQQKEKEAAEAEEARKKGEWEELAKKSETKAQKAERERDEANRRAQLAEVNIQLRDVLAKDHPEYLANAADIMLHVKEKLAPDAAPEDVTKLITAEAKAFVERTPRTKQIPGTPAGAVRGKAPAGSYVPPERRESNNVPPRRSIAASTF